MKFLLLNSQSEENSDTEGAVQRTDPASTNQNRDADKASTNKNPYSPEVDNTDTAEGKSQHAHNLIPYMVKTGVYGGHRNKRTAVSLQQYSYK